MIDGDLRQSYPRGEPQGALLMHGSDFFPSSPRTHSGEDLKLMGLQASRKYLEKEASLTEAVTGLAQEHDLNHFQIQRVCEFANNTTFKRLFEKQGESKVVEFPMADAKVVQSRTGGKPKTAAAPSMYAAEYVPGQESVDFEALFGFDKTAAAEEPSENYMLKLSHTWQGLEEELSTLENRYARTKRMCKIAARRFYESVRSVVGLEEATLADVTAVVTQRARSESFAKTAMRSVVHDLFHDGYLTKEAVGPDEVTDQEADPESPVAQSFDEFQQLIMDVQSLAQAVAQITQARDQAKAALTGGMLPSAQGPGPQTAQREGAA